MVDFGRLTRLSRLHGPRRIYGDFETRSRANIKKVGAWKYAQDPSTTILCMSYRIRHDGKTKLWRAWKGEPFPEELRTSLEEGYVFEAHNAGFERAIFKHVGSRYNMPMPQQFADTMASCAYRSLPMDLEDVGHVLQLDTQKDKRGKFLIRKLCVPQKITKNNPNEWCDDEGLLEELGEYCMGDVNTEVSLADAINDLPDDEYETWILDQTINERGVYIDLDALEKAQQIRGAVSVKLVERLRTITGGAVGSASELAKIIEWCSRKGIDLDNMTADYVDGKVGHLKSWLGKNKGEFSWDDAKAVYDVLRIRQTLGKSSTKKIDKFIDTVMDDQRIRGMLQYHGASTGRWAGRLVQPQNFPRPDEDLMKSITNGHDGMDVLLELVRTGDADVLELICGDPMEALASALRGFIIATPGHELYVADFSAIEARVLAWVAGERWKLDAFAGIDRGEGYHGSQDIYLATASTVYGYPCLTKKSHPAERQTGKTCELAFGYQGGVGAWRKFDSSDKYTDEEVDQKKKQWRNGHPMVQRLWYGLEEAAVKCVLLKKTTHYRDISFGYVQSKVGPWLACKLPNGRCLWYFNPRVAENGRDIRTGDIKYQVEYEGKDNKKGGAWGIIRTYGGMLTENVVQAISRDLMVEAMFRVERAGYPIILTVHDEIISERKIGTGGDIKEFNALMAELPAWVTKIEMPLPIAVAGYVATRYKKD